MQTIQPESLFEKVLDGLLLLVTILSLSIAFWEKAPSWLSLVVLLTFVVLFLIRWKISDDRNAYLKANWLDLVLVVLLSSPFLRLLVAFKVAGLAPVLRLGNVIRMHKTKLLQMLVLSGESLPFAAAIVFGVMFFFGTGVFLLEQGVNPQFQSINDGLWWAFVTLTTVGYGDIVPITDTGRILAVISMFFGITLYSLLIANLTYFVEELAEQRQDKSRVKKHGRKKLTGEMLDPKVRRPRKLRLKRQRLSRGKV